MTCRSTRRKRLSQAALSALQTAAHTAAASFATEELLSRVDFKKVAIASALAGASAFFTALGEEPLQR